MKFKLCTYVSVMYVTLYTTYDIVTLVGKWLANMRWKYSKSVILSKLSFKSPTWEEDTTELAALSAKKCLKVVFLFQGNSPMQLGGNFWDILVAPLNAGRVIPGRIDFSKWYAGDPTTVR